MNTAMTTQNLGNRPPTSGAEGGEVVRPQNSEFQTLKQLIKQLKDVEIVEEEDKIVIRKNGLEIAIENWGSDYDYWVWLIKASNDKVKAEIYISSVEQSFELNGETSKNTDTHMSITVKNKHVEQDLYICTKSEHAIDEINEIIEEYEEHGLAGMYYYFAEYYEPEFSFLEP